MPHLLACLEEKWMAVGGLWRGSDASEKSNEHYNTRNKKKMVISVLSNSTCLQSSLETSSSEF